MANKYEKKLSLYDPEINLRIKVIFERAKHIINSWDVYNKDYIPQEEAQVMSSLLNDMKVFWKEYGDSF